jgi:CRP/FNR family cyclic AMP-dependent transcriptional regulator
MKNSSLYSKMLDVNILRDLPEDQKIDFLDQCAVRTYDETVTVMNQGEMFDGMLLIAKGSIEISFINPNGHQAIISHVGVGAIVGAIEAVAQKPCAASCKAFPSTVVLYCATPLLFAQLRAPVFVRNLAAEMHSLLERDNRYKAIDQFYTAEQRICSYLCQLADHGDNIRQSQSYLAGLVGCSRQTINKELGLLKEKNIIAINKGGISVLDRPNLEQRIHDLDQDNVCRTH